MVCTQNTNATSTAHAPGAAAAYAPLIAAHAAVQWRFRSGIPYVRMHNRLYCIMCMNISPSLCITTLRILVCVLHARIYVCVYAHMYICICICTCICIYECNVSHIDSMAYDVHGLDLWYEIYIRRERCRQQVHQHPDEAQVRIVVCHVCDFTCLCMKDNSLQGSEVNVGAI